jgi:hypothetical protein
MLNSMQLTAQSITTRFCLKLSRSIFGVTSCTARKTTFISTTLTVGQTLSFAAKTRAPQARLIERRKDFVNSITDILSTIFGLSHVKETPVGGQLSGVSPVERRSACLSLRRWLLGVTAWDKYGPRISQVILIHL